uniref:Uncharacterized protein n=1 Tax=Arundo donax TaxID=35708 RepID=A0A0A8Z6R4_ARUDO
MNRRKDMTSKHQKDKPSARSSHTM